MALGLLVVVFGVTYVALPEDISKSNTDETFVAQTLLADTKQDPDPSVAFEEIELSAHAALVWDVRNQRILYNKNGDEALPLASVTKLMTALVAYELLDPNQKISITEEALKTEGDSGFVTGERFSLENLTDLTLIASSNDGASALGAAAGGVITDQGDAEDVFVQAMNIKARDLGLTNTEFKNTTGLDLSPTKAGAYGSARDMALLMEHIIRTIPDAIARTTLSEDVVKNEDGAYHIAENTNDAVNKIDGLIASKTGYTTLAGGNLVVAFNAGLNRPIVVVVLGSTYYDRFDDTLALVKSTQTFLASE
jgi:D-alanyl-D-alanine carboxypeptidase